MPAQPPHAVGARGRGTAEDSHWPHALPAARCHLQDPKSRPSLAAASGRAPGWSALRRPNKFARTEGPFAAQEENP
jgi:hypothetical protein